MVILIICYIMNNNMDLSGKIKSVMAVHGKSFSYVGYNDKDGLAVSSSAQTVQFE